jgi:hypothetical protein
MTAIIQDVNLLAPFEIWEVPLDHSTIKFYKPLILVPTWMPHDPDEPGDIEYIEVVCPELGIDVFADNRDDLLELVHLDIGFVWKHFVLADDKNLIPKTRAIKNNYLKIAEIIYE